MKNRYPPFPGANYGVSVVYFTEIVPVKHRSSAMLGMELFWTIGSRLLYNNVFIFFTVPCRLNPMGSSEKAVWIPFEHVFKK